MSAQGYYEDQLEEAISNLFRYYHTGGGVRLTREDAMQRLNGKIAGITDDLTRTVPND
ncbi:MAG: hypothetical protein M0Q92_15730 [Methanoregula sp.]|jgi:hypothetical protein|nr:hypothetical protein [Methanoregula sp.]